MDRASVCCAVAGAENRGHGQPLYSGQRTLDVGSMLDPPGSVEAKTMKAAR